MLEPLGGDDIDAMLSAGMPTRLAYALAERGREVMRRSRELAEAEARVRAIREAWAAWN